MPKQKYVDLQILPHHVAELEKSLPRGIQNSMEPLWLTAFAIYNMNTKLRVSVEFEGSYKTVLNYLKMRLQ